MREKNIKQDIIFVGLLLLLFAYLIAPASTNRNRLEKTEQKTDLLFGGFNNDIRQGEMPGNGIGFDKTEPSKPENANFFFYRNDIQWSPSTIHK